MTQFFPTTNNCQYWPTLPVLRLLHGVLFKYVSLTSLRHSLYQLGALLCSLNFIIQILINFTLIPMQITHTYPQNFHHQLCPTQIQSSFPIPQFSRDLKSSNYYAVFHQFNTQSLLNLPNFEALAQGKRQVKPKMITKLVTWLQKLCQETLEFSTRTLETACRILVRFLAVVDEPVCNLQLLGCACLYLSSKISETTIVAAQSYVACSLNIFSEKELMEKQAQIYKILDGNTNFLNLYDIYQFITHCHPTPTISDSHQDAIQKYLSYSLKDIHLLALPPCHLIFSILHFVVDLNTQPTPQDIRDFAISASSDQRK